VWDDLDRTSEIVTLALLGDDLLIETTRGKRRKLVHVRVEESLIVSDIEISLSSIVGDEDLSMLKWTHSSWIDIEISVELLTEYFESSSLQERSDRCCSDPFSDTREDSASDEDEFHNYDKFRIKKKVVKDLLMIIVLMQNIWICA
jgi:hypothetical protein